MSDANLFGGLSDARKVMEREPVSAPTQTGESLDSLTSTALVHGTATETSAPAYSSNFDLAKAMLGTGAATETPAPSYEGTADLAHALEQENAEAPTNTASSLAEQEVFGMAEKASAKDALEIAAVKQQIAELKAILQAKILEAQAIDPNAVPEQAKILLAQETGNEGVYFVNFLHRLIQTVDRFIKSAQQIAVNASGYSSTWAETTNQHNRMRDEQRLHAQAAG